MASWFGLGPVFAYERITRSRRWQGYALRGLFVGALLFGMSLVWESEVAEDLQTSRRQLANAGQAFYQTLTIIEIALILLAAPAATAGAICLDKSRGTLAHVMVTDLTDREVVLGKLGARLIPILNLVACALPVAALGTLLGGIDPVALTGSVLIVAGVAVVGCSLALTLSIWASKAHEVMFGVFGCWLLWLLPCPIWDIFWSTSLGPSPRWLEASHPLWLALAPQHSPGTTSWQEPVWFLTGCLVVSAVLAAIAVGRLRSVYLSQANLVATEIIDSRSEAWFRNEVRWWPGPSLDTNPVLWREWRRNRPSRPIRILWRVYVAVVSLGSLYLIWGWWTRQELPGRSISPLFNGVQVSVGLLFLAASAGTVLSEERSRGSLDVLLTTPLSTRSIVWGKWWAAYRQVLWLAFWPFVMAYTMVAVPRDPWLTSLMYCIPLLIIVQGAAITSLGLALATWISRPGQVVTWTIAAVVATIAGWPIADYLLHHSETILGLGSPFFNVGATTALLDRAGSYRVSGVSNWDVWIYLVGWSAIYAAIAGGLYLATLLTFDRCLGRSPERGKLGIEPGLRGSDSRIRPAGGRPASDAANSSPRPR